MDWNPSRRGEFPVDGTDLSQTSETQNDFYPKRLISSRVGLKLQVVFGGPKRPWFAMFTQDNPFAWVCSKG